MRQYCNANSNGAKKSLTSVIFRSFGAFLVLVCLVSATAF